MKKRYVRSPEMVKLSVNINKIATLRNSRGANNPDLVKTALDIESFGAHGITVHPRPDGRHIRTSDVYELKKSIKTEFNIEGYPTPEYIKMVNEIKPAQATLVPDPPEALTSDAGWLVVKNRAFLKTVMDELKHSGARVSLFVDPETVTVEDLQVFRQMGGHRIELYTKKYADFFPTLECDRVLKSYQKTAKEASHAGLGVNAGHDLDLKNLNYLVQNVPELMEVSIGHALICDALYMGLKETVGRYLQALKAD